MNERIPGIHSEDYEPIPPSERELTALHLVQVLRDAGMIPDDAQKKDNSYRYVTFANQPGQTEARGEVRVYGPSYLAVHEYLSGTVKVYDCLANVWAYLRLRFIDHLPDKADAVPTRQAKPRKTKGNPQQTCEPDHELSLFEDMFGPGNS